MILLDLPLNDALVLAGYTALIGVVTAVINNYFVKLGLQRELIEFQREQNTLLERVKLDHATQMAAFQRAHELELERVRTDLVKEVKQFDVYHQECAALVTRIGSTLARVDELNGALQVHARADEVDRFSEAMRRYSDLLGTMHPMQLDAQLYFDEAAQGQLQRTLERYAQVLELAHGQLGQRLEFQRWDATALAGPCQAATNELVLLLGRMRQLMRPR